MMTMTEEKTRRTMPDSWRGVPWEEECFIAPLLGVSIVILGIVVTLLATISLALWGIAG
jgi:hypothetical protein